MINNVVLMGRIVATPELKKTASDVSFTSFSLAVERAYQKQGEQKQADFIECVAWRQTAEFITRYFEKGSMIAITGSIQTRSYNDKNGNKRKVTEIVAEHASFCGAKSENNSNGDLNVAPPAPPAPPTNYDDDDDDLPF